MNLANGLPIWFELNTPDRDAAAAFYRDVVGWTTSVSPMPEHGGYVMAAAADGEPVAGMMTPPPGAPAASGWSIYFGTRDIDAIIARASELGASTAFGPMHIPHVGRFAILHDPQGIPVTIMQPDSEEATGAPFKQMPAAHGHAVWIELCTPDPNGAFAFYGGLFGWTREGAMPMGEMGDYAFIGADAARPGAIMSSTLTRAPAHWNCYFLVADIDAAIATAQGAGGTLIQGPDQIPGGYYSANIVDCHGNQVGLVGARKGAAA